MSNRQTVLATDPVTLTPRQRAIVRGYFVSGCRTLVAARALGVTSRRVREVKAMPCARAYLEALESEAVDKLTTAQAARLLVPMLP